MMKLRLCISILTIAAFATSLSASNGEKKLEVGIDEKLGQYLPMNATIVDDRGNQRTLKQLIDKPTILTLVFYECRGICTPLLTEVTTVMNSIDLEPGKDYQVLTVSFDTRDNAALAAAKKVNYMKLLNRQISPDAWRFCTADSATIAAITDAVGFRYKRQDDQFIHAGALMFIAPDGKLTRYLYGVTFLPLNVKLAIIEAGDGRIGPTTAKLLKLCFTYDPEGRTYALNITRIIGAGMIVLLIAFAIYLTAKPRKSKDERSE